MGLFALTYSVWGGLSAVAWTDVVQVVILIFGGMLMTGIALSYVTPGGGIIDGLSYIYNAVPERFSMILSRFPPGLPDIFNDFLDFCKKTGFLIPKGIRKLIFPEIPEKSRIS